MLLQTLVAKVIIWDSSSGEELGVFDHDHSIKVASFSADSRLLVTMGQNSAYIWNFLNEQEPLKLDHDDIVTAVTFDANNDFLATTKQDRIVTIWDAHSGKELSQILLDGWARYSTFSPDNKLIAIVEQNSSSPSQYFPDTTRIWDIISGKEVYRIAHNGFVSKVEFNRPGTLIYAADRANQPGGISRFNVWRLSHQDQVEINFTTNQTYLTSRTFTPNSKRLILSGNCFPNDSCTSSLYVWNISDEHSVNQLTTSKGLIRGVALEPNSLLIGWVEICSSGSCPITTHIWSLSNTQEVAQLEHHQRNPDNLLIKFSSDGERLISAGVCDRYEQNCFTEIYIWNIITNSEVAHFREMQGRTVEISNKGNLVALGKENGDITIWETQNGHKSYQLTHGGEVSKLAFSQNEQFLASANHCPGVMPCLTTIKIWELGNKHETGQLTYFDPGERSGSVGESFVEFSPDGKWLILGRPNLVIMWDFETREKVLELNLAQGNHFKGQIPKVVFSPDGKRLAIGYKDRVVRVLDVQTRKEISRVLHSDAVSTLAFSPDGNWIVSGEHCIDTCPATVRIWNVETGKEIKQIIHNDTISSAYFSPDGKFLVSSGGNNLKLSLWHPDDLIKMACKRLNRNLTQAEWAQFLPNDKYELTCPNLGEPKE
ncbi:MAG: hypothetical protein HS126_40130 [Anaerolineales bacterium]|nr:hypothetical protein [Anaerolineales bacterium]